ncbi:MAG: hypothetical protein F7C37_06165 [Desulfurococcales archaeon]|nr:hypothetical protein [Desulfurococcales archaeon]
MACEREAVMKVIVKLKRALADELSDCPKECREKAINRVIIHQLELEDLLAQEPTFSR